MRIYKEPFIRITIIGPRDEKGKARGYCKETGFKVMDVEHTGHHTHDVKGFKMIAEKKIETERIEACSQA